jgi:hypothetical protein
MLVERAVQLIDILRRRWLWFVLPLFFALPAAYFYIKSAPIKYSAKSVILLQAANRSLEWNNGAGGFPRQNVIEQISVIEAWLKSDHVLEELMPQLIDGPPPVTPTERFATMARLRNAITFELVGNAVLEVRFDGAKGQGLGRKLEILVARMLEGVMNPEQGILNAEQLIMVRHTEAVEEAEKSLNAALLVANVGAPDQVKSKLRQIFNLQHGQGRVTMAEASSGAGTDAAVRVERQTDNRRPMTLRSAEEALQRTAEADQERKALSNDAELVAQLEKLYKTYDDAQLTLNAMVQRSRTSANTFVRVFDAPERLVIIGRPRDPIHGEKSAFKYAIAGLFGLMLLVTGAALLHEILDRRLYTRDEFEGAAGIPVIGRLPRR